MVDICKTSTEQAERQEDCFKFETSLVYLGSSKPAYQSYVADPVSKINPSSPPKTMKEWIPLRLELEPQLYYIAYTS